MAKCDIFPLKMHGYRVSRRIFKTVLSIHSPVWVPRTKFNSYKGNLVGRLM